MTIADRREQFSKARKFYLRLNKGTGSVDDEHERERYIAQRRGR